MLVLDRRVSMWTSVVVTGGRRRTGGGGSEIGGAVVMVRDKEGDGLGRGAPEGRRRDKELAVLAHRFYDGDTKMAAASADFGN
jgi:hypothetical protein